MCSAGSTVFNPAPLRECYREVKVTESPCRSLLGFKLVNWRDGREEVHGHNGIKNLPLVKKEPRIMNTTQWRHLGYQRGELLRTLWPLLKIRQVPSETLYFLVESRM